MSEDTRNHQAVDRLRDDVIPEMRERLARLEESQTSQGRTLDGIADSLVSINERLGRLQVESKVRKGVTAALIGIAGVAGSILSWLLGKG